MSFVQMSSANVFDDHSPIKRYILTSLQNLLNWL
ncbi:hypothetical protein GYH30_011255 [Glycine max]|nr:hypothetical protein GYH30_011255 [Glycine max]